MKLNKKGFTLIELLIVIAILGAIAVIALLAIDPLEQLARSRDAGKLSTTAQLGHAIQAYATSNDSYPANATWGTELTTSGEVNTMPTAVGSVACGQNPVNTTWCYNSAVSGTGRTQAVVFARLESRRSQSLCNTGETAWAVYSTEAGRGGTICTANATTYPAPGVTSFAN